MLLTFTLVVARSKILGVVIVNNCLDSFVGFLEDMHFVLLC